MAAAVAAMAAVGMVVVGMARLGAGMAAGMAAVGDVTVGAAVGVPAGVMAQRHSVAWPLELVPMALTAIRLTLTARHAVFNVSVSSINMDARLSARCGSAIDGRIPMQRPGHARAFFFLDMRRSLSLHQASTRDVARSACG